MSYPKRFLLAKFLVTASLFILAGLSLWAVQGHRAAQVMALINGAELYIVLTLAVIHLGLLLPLLYLVWGGLHGTGRSVRMAAMICAVVAGAPLLAGHLSASAWGEAALHQSYFIVIEPLWGLAVFGPLALGLILSIKPRT